MIERRAFLAGAAALVASPSLLGADDAQLPRRAPGELDIHHIATGRGNATLVVAPSGETLLIDCGSVTRTNPSYLPPIAPADATSGGDAVARYVLRRLREERRSRLDTVMLTHFHGDHIGEFRDDLPRVDGYAPTGISELAQRVRIARIVDRGYPNYDYPAPLTDPTTTNYRAFVAAYLRRGGRIERFSAGSSHQLALHASGATPLRVQNLTVNGTVWTGAGETTTADFPDPATLTKSTLPDENMCCAAIRIRYGRFAYYTGGDLTFQSFGAAWRDIETPTVRACGPVDVAQLDHHGYHDACGVAFVRELRARAYIVPAWHVTHPAISVVDRLESRALYPNDRDLYLLTSTPANQAVNERFSASFTSLHGHVVVRVAADGATYRVFVTDERDERDLVLAMHGPYTSGTNS